MITQSQLLNTFEYLNGNLIWKINKGKRAKIGNIAGTIRKDKRIQLIINGKSYLSHRLIYLYHNGFMPKFIDHIDGNPQNNNIDNLRPATKAQNQWNRKVCNKNTSGIKGINWHIQHNKWNARISVNGKRIELGLFEDKKIAELAVINARKKYHKQFARNI